MKAKVAAWIKWYDPLKSFGFAIVPLSSLTFGGQNDECGDCIGTVDVQFHINDLENLNEEKMLKKHAQVVLELCIEPRAGDVPIKKRRG